MDVPCTAPCRTGRCTWYLADYLKVGVETTARYECLCCSGPGLDQRSGGRPVPSPCQDGTSGAINGVSTLAKSWESAKIRGLWKCDGTPL